MKTKNEKTGEALYAKIRAKNEKRIAEIDELLVGVLRSLDTQQQRVLHTLLFDVNCAILAERMFVKLESLMPQYNTSGERIR